MVDNRNRHNKIRDNNKQQLNKYQCFAIPPCLIRELTVFTVLVKRDVVNSVNNYFTHITSFWLPYSALFVMFSFQYISYHLVFLQIKYPLKSQGITEWLDTILPPNIHNTVWQKKDGIIIKIKINFGTITVVDPLKLK